MRYRRGDDGELDDAHLQFAWGFIERISVECGMLLSKLEPTLRAALDLPSSRFVRAIDLEDNAEALDLMPALALLGERAPTTLRKLSLRGGTHLQDFGTFARRLPLLRELVLDVTLAPAAIYTLVDSPFPELRALELAASYWPPILKRADLPKLTYVLLRGPFQPEHLDRLVASPLAAQIETLAFSRMHAKDAKLLLDHLDAFPKLRSLGAEVHEFGKKLDSALRERIPDLWDYGFKYDD